MLYRIRKVLFAAALFGGMIGTEAQAQFHLLHLPLLLAGPHLFRGPGVGIGALGFGHMRGIGGGVGLATMGGNPAIGLGSGRMRGEPFGGIGRGEFATMRGDRAIDSGSGGVRGRSGGEYYAARRYGRYLSGPGYSTGGYDNSDGYCTGYRRSRQDDRCD